MNTKVRLFVRRAYGVHAAEVALALVMLACGPIDLDLPPRAIPRSVGGLVHARVRRAGVPHRRVRSVRGPYGAVVVGTEKPTPAIA